MNRDYIYTSITPHKRQLAHQRMEFYGFIHFTVNTYTDKEWGDGTESPFIFDPVELDVTGWAQTAKKAGMTGLILTCKHHDGFCLWKSKYTDHSVASSPCDVDIVKALSEACKEEGIRFGVYLSPWDRNNPAYGQGKAYDDYYVNQLEELLTGYGDIFCVWLDGACGEGANGKVQRYDWERYYACVRHLQPHACICVCGPDIRWCGNEAGDTRPSEWSVVPARTALAERIQEKSQQADDASFRKAKINSWDLDLGSREALEMENELIWYPAEVDTSIRPGFFYHESEDHQQKTLSQLKDIYYRSVGGNATLLLNIPPMPNGRLHKRDCEILEEFGAFLQDAFSRNFINEEAKVRATAEEPGHEIINAIVDDDTNWFQTPVGQTTTQIQIDFGKVRACTHLVMKEPIWLSQRIECFHVQLFHRGTCIAHYDGTIVGYKKILPIEGSADRIVITIQDARIFAALEFVGVY